ncbi:hypothetical protein JTF12_13300 [Leclercia adecarboxylata]|jgi:hypothetical protein|uniref:hypothetical protein n=1 Tax=Leclercia adecarboxylata TaxID=83655 RepID=UPI00194ECE97|nr:hypothetical protein [Leclercia adecarboxylata]MBM6635303.1 hypothetical protein [Leclercia adecarboxylata]
MTTGNFDALVSAARVQLEPLDAHFIAGSDAALQDDYLTLLAALLLEKGALTEAQLRLMMMLIAVIQPVFPLAHYLQQSAKLDSEGLARIVRNLGQTKQAAQALLFDFAVLQRITGPLAAQQVERLGWLAKICGLGDKQILLINFWSLRLLGIKTSVEAFSGAVTVVKTANVDHLFKENMQFKDKSVCNGMPQINQIVKKGSYVFKQNSSPSGSFWGLVSDITLCRFALVPANGLVTRVIMDATKNANDEYGKNGEPLFEIIPLPPAFNAWRSFLTGKHHD